MKIVAIGCFALGLVASAPMSSAEVMAADLTVKAMPVKAPMAAPVSWTGFYIGGQIGGGGASRFANPTANDPVAAVLLSGAFAFPGDQPVASNRFNISGLTGGIEIGYNWQVDRSWLVGIEADFSGSNLKGGGSGTSFLQQFPGATFTQTLSIQQRVDWYGTLRGRLGWLPTQDLLLFATGGFAYGNLTNSGTYTTNGPFVALVGFNGAGFSFGCLTNSTCFAGSSASTRTGWTLGGGGEWMFWRNWSAKVEYQYVNLGGDAVPLTATAVAPLAPPGATLSSFNANIPRDDFHVVRAGVNYHF
jgi:outer membrane immunogenic protein